MVVVQRISDGAAKAVVPQKPHQSGSFTGRDAVAGQGGGGARGVRGGAQAEVQRGGQSAQGQLAGGGATAGLQAGGGGAQRGVSAAAVAIRGRLRGHGRSGWRVSHQTRLD